jgi:5-phospho-D-xylono-1,4-lactonase
MAGHPTTTVLGPRKLDAEWIIDAHGHVWIDPVPGGSPDAPQLHDEAAIVGDLHEFAASGGQAIVDCQPPGAGRNAARLIGLAQATGITLVASTGFHLPRYYAPERSPWHGDADRLVSAFLAELGEGMEDGRGGRLPARAGAVKSAHLGTLDDDSRRLFEAAVCAARGAGVLLVIHTERGAGVEELCEFLRELAMPPQDVVLCHVDKRPDFALHRELARAGFLLEYDTFLRPKYAPELHVWPLLEQMLADGRDQAIACGLDLADWTLWRFGGNPHGMRAFVEVILPGLRERGASEAQVRRLTGGNIAERLSTSGMRSLVG